MKTVLIFLFILFFISFLSFLPYLYTFRENPTNKLRYMEIKKYNSEEKKIFYEYDTYSKFLNSDSFAILKLIGMLIEYVNEICNLLIKNDDITYQRKLNELLEQKKIAWRKFKEAENCFEK